MKIKYFFFIFSLLLLVLLSSCASNQSPQQTPVHSTSQVTPAESSSQDSSQSSEDIADRIANTETYSGDLYIIDTHAHFIPTDEEINDQYLENLVALAEKAGVAKIALGLHARQVPDQPPVYSEQHDEWVLAAAEKYPDMIIPFLAGFDPQDPDAPAYVEEQLKTGKWKGIGELDLRNQVKQVATPMNSTIMMEIYKLAAAYNVPVMVHYNSCYETDCDNGDAEYENAIKENPETIFIHAHNCPDEMMKKYENLYCEPENIMLTLPNAAYLDRVIIGSDIQHTDLKAQKTYNYEEFIAAVRENLETLDAEDAALVAHGTAEKLFHLE